MTENLRAAVLGAVQGLTEFLPVSSDGHLNLFQAFLGGGSLAMDVVLHAGTLFAMALFFRADLFAIAKGLKQGIPEERRRFLMILAATVPTGIIGLALKDKVESLAASLAAAGIGFLLTAAVLGIGESQAKRGERLTVPPPYWHAVLIGIAQGAAVWPGLSRSASTIAVALCLGWRWDQAGRFSFLAAIPAIGGATVLMMREMSALPLVPSLIGFTVSFFVGLGALFLLMRFLAARRLWPFAVYTALLGLYALLKSVK